ncbi:MAG: ParB N-terminal domain-containing protein [Rhizobium sp.]|nr:ParB N-terminal domain-containing protein [Rhizobium sp.]
MLKADHAHQQLLLVVQGLKRLFADEHFVTLLRAEGLDSLAKYLADRIETACTSKEQRHELNQHCEAALPWGLPQPDADKNDAPYPKALLNLTPGFDLETFQIPLEELMPSKKVPDGVMTTRKFKQIVSSIREIGLIEPLSVIKPDPDAAGFLLLDGNLRVLALKELGQDAAPCPIAKDFETYTYNDRINRLSTVQEHYMLRRTIDKGVSEERLARAFNVNLLTINSRINLLHGICPKAVELLQVHQFTPDVTRHLRKMKAARQIKAVELVIAANTITAAHADALLKATPPEQRTHYKPPQPVGDPLEQIVKLAREMSQVQEKYKHAEENYGSELLNLVVAKGYLKKLMENAAVRSYVARHASEIFEQFELVLNTVSMEEAMEHGRARPKRQRKPNWRKTTATRRRHLEWMANSRNGLGLGSDCSRSAKLTNFRAT